MVLVESGEIPASSVLTVRPNGGSSSKVNELEMRPLTTTGADKFIDEEILDDKVLEEEIIDSMLYPRVEERPWNLQDFLYPPALPRSCQLLRKENIAIPVSYLLVGILMGLLGPLINVYPLDLGATEAQQTTLTSLRSLPATFKLIFGFISDNFPLFGFRRKSYMAIGWGVAAAVWGA